MSASAAERAAPLVSVEANVASRDVVLRHAGLAGAGDAHDDDHLTSFRAGGPLRATGRGDAERTPEHVSGAGVEDQPGCAGGRPRRLGASRAWDRDHDGGQSEQPGERDLGRRRTERARDLGQRLLATAQPASTARPAERGVGDHRDAQLLAALDDAAAESTVVVGAERDLDGGDRDELDRLVQLPSVYVRDPGALDQALVEEPAERADGGPPRGARVGRMDQVDIDRQALERVEARLAVGEDCLGAAVRYPRPAGRVIPPLVTTRALLSRCTPAGCGRAGARCGRGRDSPRAYAWAVSNTVTPAASAASIVSRASASSRSGSVDIRMQPRPMRSSDGEASPDDSGAVAYVTRAALTLTLGEAAHWWSNVTARRGGRHHGPR